MDEILLLVKNFDWNYSFLGKIKMEFHYDKLIEFEYIVTRNTNLYRI